MTFNYNEKIIFFKESITNIQLAIKNYHLLGILNSNDVNICLDGLEKIINLLNTISDDNMINDLQYI